MVLLQYVKYIYDVLFKSFTIPKLLHYLGLGLVNF